MSELFLHEDLLGSDPKKEVRETARIQTLTVLNRLDGKRKGSVLQFLYESRLIESNLGTSESIVDLTGANLTEYYQILHLEEANLSKANLSGVSNITTQALEKQAMSLQGATMPDGSLHP